MKSTPSRTIELHPLAPPKPVYGSVCNGCGVCCAAEPCPVAMIFLLQLRGRCRALMWQDDASRYVCGMVICPDRYMTLVPLRWRQGLGRWFASRIAAGKGCDSTIEVDEAGQAGNL